MLVDGEGRRGVRVGGSWSKDAGGRRAHRRFLAAGSRIHLRASEGVASRARVRRLHVTWRLVGGCAKLFPVLIRARRAHRQRGGAAVSVGVTSRAISPPISRGHHEFNNAEI